MGLRFCLGGSGSGKSTMIYKEIIKRSMEHEEEEFLIIVPDQFTMQTQKELCSLHPTKGIMNIDVLSFSRLAHRIFEEIYVEEKTVLDDTGKNLIIRNVAANEEEKLRFMGNKLKKIGYVHEVKSMISEFMQYGIGKEELLKIMEYVKNNGQLYAKLQDLYVVYDGFLEEIKESYITTEETLDILRGVLHKSQLMKRATVVFDGFTGFTPVQNRLIQEILRLSKEVIVTLVFDTRENPYVLDGEHKLFYLTKKTIASLTKLSEEVEVERFDDILLRDEVMMRYKENPCLSHLERNLFRYPFTKYEEDVTALTVLAAQNPRMEIQKVCLEIKRLLREENYYYRDIAIVAGSLEEYGNLLETECKRYQIPYFLDQNLGLMFHPMIHFLLGALDVIRYRFSYESVFGYLRNGLADITMEETDRLENYVKSLGIRGKSAYENAFVRRTDRMKEEEDAAKALEALNQTREALIESLKPLLTLGECESGTRYIDALYEFCVQNRLFEKMQQMTEAFEERNELARAKEYGQVYRVVMDLFDQIHELLGTKELKLSDFIEILTAGFSELKVSTIPPNIDQIVVGDIERTRLKNIRALFFIGVNDGFIPKSSGKGGYISDLDREFLLGSGYEMAPTLRAQMFTQKLYLYMNVTKPTDKLYIAYSKVDNSGKSVRPSYLINELKNLYPKLKIQSVDMTDLYQCVESKQDGYDDLAVLLGRYASGQLDADEKRKREFFDFLKLYKSDTWVKDFVDAAFYEYKPTNLSSETAKLIYGNVLYNSVSRLEKFAGCAYAHFVKYGLKLQPEEAFSFESVDMGTVFHDVIARFCAYLRTQGESLLTFTKETMEEFTHKTLEEVAALYGGTVLYDSARNAFIIKRMERILNRTFMTLQYQLKKGLFEPAAFEIPFELVRNLGIHKGKMQMNVTGRIDRIDKVEKDGNTYIKVIDYKSGNSKFDPVALYYGTQMQLAVYLNAAVAMEKAQKEQRGEKGEVIPTAILYYHMQDPFVERTEEKMSFEEIEAKRKDALRMDGLVNADDTCIEFLDSAFEQRSDVIPVERKKSGGYSSTSKIAEQIEFDIISEFVEQKMDQLAGEMLSGQKEISPYEQSGKTACTFCEFASICKYDEKIPGFEKREFDKMSDEEAMEKIRAKVEKEGENDGN